MVWMVALHHHHRTSSQCCDVEANVVLGFDLTYIPSLNDAFLLELFRSLGAYHY
uniref:Uncharacterized protein n=1 Tax=Anopheles dirus TaxID=7168 RepID=A0A182NXI3_9DIPT